MNTYDGVREAESPIHTKKYRQSNGLASRPSSLSGVRLGLLSNGKPNAGALLRVFGYRLADRVGLSLVVSFEKPEFGDSVDDRLVSQILDSCDIAIVGVGD